MAYLANNNAATVLAGSLTNVATTMTLHAGHGDRFPIIAGVDYTYATITNAAGAIEIVKITIRSSASDTITIERAQEGTTALAWNAGDSVEGCMTAALVVAAMAHWALTSGAHDVSAITGAAPLASPTFTGTPAAPTAAVGTNTTQLATCAHVKASTFPAATTMPFAMAAAPTGWTKSTTHNDKALRVVSGSGGGAGGTTAFSTVMASRTPAGSVNISGGTVGGHAITEAEMAAHTHGIYDAGHAHTYGGRLHSPGTGQYGANNPYGTDGGRSTELCGTGISLYAAGGNSAHDHPFTPPSGSFSGSAMDFAIQYVDVIICSKDA